MRASKDLKAWVVAGTIAITFGCGCETQYETERRSYEYLQQMQLTNQAFQDPEYSAKRSLLRNQWDLRRLVSSQSAIDGLIERGKALLDFAVERAGTNRFAEIDVRSFPTVSKVIASIPYGKTRQIRLFQANAIYQSQYTATNAGGLVYGQKLEPGDILVFCRDPLF